MRPGNKKERAVCKADGSFKHRLLSKKEQEHSYGCFKNHGTIYKSGKIDCAECGTTFKKTNDMGLDEECPNCKKTIRVVYNTRTWSNTLYYSTYKLHKGYQVVSTFEIYQYKKVKTIPRYMIKPISRVYYDVANFKVYPISSSAGGMFSSSWHGEISLKKYSDRYIISTNFVAPRVQIHPLYKKYFNVKSYKEFSLSGLNLQSCFHYINNSMFETMFKNKRYNLCSNFKSHTLSTYEKYWSVIKLVMKNKYPIKSISIYIDYLDFCLELGYDIHSQKYFMPKPENLNKLHDRYQLKVTNKNRRIELKKRLKIRKEEEALYKKHIKKIRKTELTRRIKKDLILKIKPFLSVTQIEEESKTLKHCAYTSKYYQRNYSYMFSASINNKPIATIEYNINDKKVSQCRGHSNQKPMYYNDIVEILNSVKL